MYLFIFSIHKNQIQNKKTNCQDSNKYVKAIPNSTKRISYITYTIQLCTLIKRINDYQT